MEKRKNFKKICFFCLGILCLFAKNKVTLASEKQSGLTLDVARRYYSVSTIKEYIDIIHQNKGTFLQLHLSDDENYALESKLLGQTTKHAIRTKNGAYLNVQTNRKFLSYKQIEELESYAKKKQVHLIPEIDTPAHAKAILQLVKNKYGEKKRESLRQAYTVNQIDYIKKENVLFIQSLYQEVVKQFPKSPYFHMGGDEFVAVDANNQQYIHYVNQMAKWAKKNKKILRLWNDGLLKEEIKQLNHSVEVTYWSYDGDKQNPKEVRQLRKERASLPDLLKNKIKVLNYNSYYLYLVPSKRTLPNYSSKQSLNFFKENWQLQDWDGADSTYQENNIASSHYLIGSSISIWSEESSPLSEEKIVQGTKPYINQYFQLVTSKD
ncbi:family 20 glycosylhydrolase [Vagococcus entomophilus]|uniref:Glycoside hydrolase family 20 catalytic domain-containing protein n=1 Tax=Vagococcus entomophilus TaxID=1160095 RepID=A0A430AIG3_9ENTE|nr:family 20 glycosylhydrolase [Vagococcus entomophilus]RSU07697.1 hypothetical protein CBF30_00200 [Vagococcus entomophilus]